MSKSDPTTSNFGLAASVASPALIGMVHLKALPGSPNFEGNLAAVESAALADAHAIAVGGAQAVMMENFGDTPFFAGRVPAETVAAMTRIAMAIRNEVDLPLGVNVLRNDGFSAIAIAQVVGAAFVRVNVLAGATLTDQGIITGRAAELLRFRQALGADRGAQRVAIWADVAVKHAAPIAPRPLAEEVDELIQRAGADAVIVSGTGTGSPVDMDDLRAVRAAAGSAPVIIGSGANLETLPACRGLIDGAIAGTSVKESVLNSPVSSEKLKALGRLFSTS